MEETKTIVFVCRRYVRADTECFVAETLPGRLLAVRPSVPGIVTALSSLLKSELRPDAPQGFQDAYRIWYDRAESTLSSNLYSCLTQWNEEGIIRKDENQVPYVLYWPQPAEGCGLSKLEEEGWIVHAP